MPTTTPPQNLKLTDTGTYTFELSGQKTGDTVSDYAIVMRTLENDSDGYDATIYTDGAAANEGGGIIVTTGPLSDPRVHRQCTIPAGK